MIAGRSTLGEFHAAAGAALSAARRGVRDRSPAALQQAQTALCALAPEAYDAERRSIFAYSVGCALALEANALLCLHDFAGALSKVRLGWALLEAETAWRAAGGYPAAGLTEPRQRLLTTLGELKWRCADDSLRTEIIEPHAIIDYWLYAKQRTLEKLRGEFPGRTAAPQAGSDRARALVEVNRWLGLVALSLAWRYDRGHVALLVPEFNDWQADAPLDAPLSPDWGHWRTLREPPRHPWYWHWELVKAWLSRREPGRALLPSGLQRLAGPLLAAAESSQDQGYYADGLRRDLAALTDLIRAERMLEVIELAS
jgi:hypothetical protein